MINKLITLFINDQDIAENSKKQYSLIIKSFFEWAEIDGFSPEDITRPVFILFKDRLIKDKKSSLTVGNYLTVVRVFYLWAERNDIYKNITTGIRNPKRSYTGFKKYPLLPDQIRLLNQSIDNSKLKGKRDLAIINLMIRTGLRQSEVTKIDLKDIQLKNNKLGIYIQGKGKQFKDAFVRISDKTEKYINDYLTTRKIYYENEPLFTQIKGTEPGKRLHPQTLSKLIKTRFRYIGLDSNKYTAHSLRHTTAILLLEAGLDIYKVQIRMRHSSPVTTQLYTRWIEEKMEMQNDTLEKIDNIIDGNNNKNKLNNNKKQTK